MCFLVGTNLDLEERANYICVKLFSEEVQGTLKTDYDCKIKETLFIQELEPAFNVNVGSETLMLY